LSIISIRSTLFTPILTVNHRIPLLFCGNTGIDRSCFPSVSSPNIEAWSFLIKLLYRNLHVAFDFISQSTISNQILDTKIDRSFSHIHVDQILGQSSTLLSAAHTRRHAPTSLRWCAWNNQAGKSRERLARNNQRGSCGERPLGTISG